MELSRNTISSIDPAKVIVPSANIFELPERVLQFGTGVLLRGLPDYFIDKANRQGIFNGRIVMIKSTTTGNIEPYVNQDGLYTICIRGPHGKEMIDENIISSVISRVLSANEDWLEVLAFACNPQIKIIISNTTEVGIQFVKEDVRKIPPKSFPGKLLAFLLERFKTFGVNKEGDMVIIPTELISDNGIKLKSILLEMAEDNGLEEQFIDWLKNHIHFCSSLVDRIVPGKPDNDILTRLKEELGYEDELLIMAEPYRLWAIEGDTEVKKVLSFAESDQGVIVTPDINRYRELKLRLLNGTHTLSCGLAHLAGFNTVHDAMVDKNFFAYVKNVMLSEIALAIPFDLPKEETQNFGLQVLERFSNPYIRHPWLNITLNYTSKMKSRNVPVLLNYFEKYKTIPINMTLGFAAYLLFMKAVRQENDKYYGYFNSEYLINDEMAGYYYKLWQTKKVPELVLEVLQNEELWGHDLSVLTGFSKSVTDSLMSLMENGAATTLSKLQSEKIIV